MTSAARLIGIALVLLSGTIAGIVSVTSTCDARPARAVPQKCTAPMAPGSSC